MNPIKIRVGVDYGPTDKVLWSHYGIPGCNELTTTSLHTDLAAKLQARANNNSIRIGKNIVEALDLPSEFYFTPTKKVDGEDISDYYILQSVGFNYNQYQFDWEKYLNSFDFINKKGDGTLEIVGHNTFKLKCTITNPLNNSKELYFQNSNSIPKTYSLKFELYKNGSLYQKLRTEEIVWQAFNRGKEADNAKMTNHDFGGNYKNLNYCNTSTAYLGHHYLKCTIKRGFGDNVVLKFPVFVQ